MIYVTALTIGVATRDSRRTYEQWTRDKLTRRVAQRNWYIQLHYCVDESLEAMKKYNTTSFLCATMHPETKPENIMYKQG